VLRVFGCVWYVEICLLGRLGRLEGLGACFLGVWKLILEFCVRVLFYVETVVEINISEGLRRRFLFAMCVCGW